MKKLIAGTLAAAALGGGIVLASPAQAGGFNTIFPNYSDSNCPGGGKVNQVNVAAVPGNSTRSPMGQRWARLEAGKQGQVQIIASVLCVSSNGKGSAWRTVVRSIKDPVAWKSYYF